MGTEGHSHRGDLTRHLPDQRRLGPTGAGIDVKRWESASPVGRTGEHGELANLAAYLVSDQAGYINGDCITIDGGRWLQGAGMFSLLSGLSEAEWQEMRAQKSS